MRRVLFIALFVGLFACASTAWANNFVGRWMAGDQNQQWLVQFNADGSFSRKVTMGQQVHNEQGQYQVQGQNIWVQVQGEAQGYAIQYKFINANTLELYEDGQFLAQLVRLDNQGNPMVSAQGGQQGGQGYGQQGGQGFGQQGGQGYGRQSGAQGMRGGGQTVSDADAQRANDVCKQAYHFLAEKQYDKLIAACNQALGIDPRCLNAYFLRGLCYYQKDDLNQAVADYSMAMKIHPPFPNPHLNRAAAYMEMKRFPEALADVDNYLKLKPGDQKGLDLRQEILKRQAAKQQGNAGGRQGALSGGGSQTGAGQVSPQDQAKAHAERALQLYEQDKFEEAVAACNQSLALDPRQHSALLLRGAIYSKTDRFTQAVEDLTKVMQLNPKSNLAYFFRALANLNLDRYDQALADVREYMRRNPKDPDGPDLEGKILKFQANAKN